MSKPRSTSTTSNIINSTSATKASNDGVPVVMQPEINRRGSWSNPPKLPKPDPPKVIKPPSATSASDTPAVSVSTAFIDSALLAALRDPRERIGLLRLEQTLIDFVVKQPQDLHMDVGGPYNSIVKSPTLGLISSGISNANKSQTSFQRCILHRLADRFEITRENNMDGTIRLLKQAQTKIPSRLLLDVKPEEYSLVQSMEQVSLTTTTNNQNATAAPSDTKPIAVAGASKPKTSRRNSNEVSVVVKKNNSDSKAVTKMKIMKRANSCPADSSMHRTNSSASLKKKNSSLTDREKAYAEARARIFQQEEEEQQQQDESDDANGTASGTASTDSGAVLVESNEETQETKATFRDRNQDEIDPDFRRGSQLNVGLDYGGGGEHYTNPTKDYYGYYNAPQQYPRHYTPQAQVWVPTDAGAAAAYYPHQYHAHYPATTTQGQQTYVASTSSAQDLTSKIVANSDSVGG